MREELEVWWNGSHKDRYLCIPEYRARQIEAELPPEPVLFEDDPLRRHQDRSRERELILRVLAARGSYRVTELRALCRLSPSVLGGVLDRLITKGIVKRQGFGVVALADRR